MTLIEFYNRTKFLPTQEYFDKSIHPQYMSSELDKDDFCKEWFKKGGIQKAYDYMVELKNKRERNEQAQIRLKEKYERELNSLLRLEKMKYSHGGLINYKNEPAYC